LFGFPSQSPKPAAHVGVHTPDTQAVDPLAFVHSTPQAPQLFASVSGFVAHMVPQQMKGGAQGPQTSHTPPMQTGELPAGAVQTLPHAPQLLASTCMSVSHPFTGLPSQSPKPGTHEGTQVPWTVHMVVPWAFVHGTQLGPHSPHEPHGPQFQSG
jgi:hypothetical protein